MPQWLLSTSMLSDCADDFSTQPCQAQMPSVRLKIAVVGDVDPATLAVLRERARSLGQSLSGYLRDLMDADAATETNAEVIARIARDREPVDLTMDDILAARDEGRR